MAEISDLSSKLGGLSKQQLIRIGILVVVLLLLGVVITCNLMTPNYEEMEGVKSTFQRDAHWVCLECGYEEDGKAGQGPLECPDCGEEAFYVGFMQRCPKGHGPFLVSYNYDDKGNINRIKVDDGPWVEPIDEAKKTSNKLCPVCGELLLPPGM